MTVKYTGSKQIVDSPFAKMLYGVSLEPLLGLPPIATDADIAPLPEYEQAAIILGIDKTAQQYTAFLIRHLDFVIRNSSLKDDIDWPSSSYSMWDSSPLITFDTGLIPLYAASSTFTLKVMPNQTPPNLTKLTTKFTITGSSPLFTLTGSDGYTESKLVIVEDYFTLSDTGMDLWMKHTIPGSISTSISFDYVKPYKFDMLRTANSIKAAKELLSVLSKDKPEYQKFIYEQASAEDTIAAFILCLDKFNG
jgi:hypothetical protein